MQKKKKKTKLFIFLIICFVLLPFLLTKGCNYMESLNQAENSISEPISSASAYTHIHERAYNAQGHSIRKANWTGTAVPNSGKINKIYLNNNLSIEETNSILDSLEYDSEIGYIIFSSEGTISQNTVFMTVNKFNNVYAILYRELPVYIGGVIEEAEFIGWSEYITTLAGVFDFTNDNINFSNTLEGYSVGLQNDKIKEIISTTPFEQSSDNELSIGNLFTQLGNAMIIFGSAVVNVFISMEPIFWNNGPTLMFILLIAGVSFALVFWGIELLISLIGVFKTKRKKKK